MRSKVLWIALSLLGMAVASGTAHADSITYTISGTASGESFSASFTGNTANVEALPGGGGIEVVPVTGTFNIAGTTGTFNTKDAAGSPLVISWNATTGNVGLSYLSLDSTGGDPTLV